MSLPLCIHLPGAVRKLTFLIATSEALFTVIRFEWIVSSERLGDINAQGNTLSVLCQGVG